MAQTRANAVPKFDPEKDVTWLQQIEQQINTASEVDRSARMSSQQWKGRAEKLQEMDAARTEDSRLPTTEDMQTAAKILTALSEALNPLAAFSWKQEDVVAAAERVRSFVTLALMPDELVEEANRLVTVFTETKKAKGTTTVYPDRPAKVVVTGPGGEEITTQAGNTANSSGNIRGSIVKWLEGKGVTVTDEQKELIGKCVSQSLKDKVPVVSIGDFATITHKTN